MMFVRQVFLVEKIDQSKTSCHNGEWSEISIKERQSTQILS